jgi:hypothetical protein
MRLYSTVRIDGSKNNLPCFFYSFFAFVRFFILPFLDLEKGYLSEIKLWF